MLYPFRVSSSSSREKQILIYQCNCTVVWLSDHMDQAGRCKKHPKHKQPPGVCSVCLTERLSKLAASSNKKAKNVRRVDHSYTSSSDVSSSFSTVSSPSSPAGERMDLGSRVFFSGPLGGREMFRSKSMAVVVGGKGGSVERGNIAGKDVRGKSGNGFWSKLMRVGSMRRKEVLVHSKSVNVPAPAALVAARN